MNRLAFEFFYLGPTLTCTGVCDFLPYLTIARWNGGGGYVGAGWIFWSVTVEWRSAKRR